MTISPKRNGDSLVIALEGRLDSLTAPELEKELEGALTGVRDLTLDFAGLEYVSSSGMRVLLAAQQAMIGQGEMTLVHVNDTIMEIFDVTGFSEILTIQ